MVKQMRKTSYLLACALVLGLASPAFAYPGETCPQAEWLSTLSFAAYLIPLAALSFLLYSKKLKFTGKTYSMLAYAGLIVPLASVLMSAAIGSVILNPTLEACSKNPQNPVCDSSNNSSYTIAALLAVGLLAIYAATLLAYPFLYLRKKIKFSGRQSGLAGKACAILFIAAFLLAISSVAASFILGG
jgi:hypothetical protein